MSQSIFQDEHLVALAADYDAVHDNLRAEITTLTGVIDAIVNEPVSMLLAQAAGLVRLVGPDDWPADAIPRPPVVTMAMRVKDAADMQRTIARDRAQRAGQASECSICRGRHGNYKAEAHRQAWPRARDLLSRAAKAFRDWYAQNDLRELDAALSRAESAELGCEIAYLREPTQAEGDAHEYRNEQSMGASEAIRECHVPMGNHHGHRCLCGRWVWGGPTVCQRCVDAEAVKITLEWKAEADRLRLRVDAVKLLLEANGCDCDCEHHHDEHGADCDRCLACRISWQICKS